jgi:hypothetical protein
MYVDGVDGSIAMEDNTRPYLVAELGYTTMLNKDGVEQRMRLAYLMTPITEADEAYNEAHSKENPNFGARTVAYVRFDIEASEADKAEAEAAIMKADAAVKAANGDIKAIKSAIRGVEGKVEKYVAVSSLS